jgi:hypothetical protein
MSSNYLNSLTNISFKEKHYLNNQIFSYGEMIFHQVLMRINSNRVAKQFILEELEAAFLATKDPNNEIANILKEFVENSGFTEKDFNGAMMRSFDEVDGVGGPKQTLLHNIFALPLTNPEKALVRTEVVGRILNRFKGEI